jgi:hypothetical protein
LKTPRERNKAGRLKSKKLYTSSRYFKQKLDTSIQTLPMTRIPKFTTKQGIKNYTPYLLPAAHDPISI